MNKDNASTLASYVSDLKGNRTLRQMSKDCGVAMSYIGSIIRGEHIPSLDVMRKLTNPASNPQNGVTIEDLLEAVGVNGYSSQEELFWEKDKDDGENTVSLSAQEVSYDKSEIVQYTERDWRLDQIRTILYECLLRKGIGFELGDERPPYINVNDISSSRRRSKFTLHIREKEAVNEWVFYSLIFQKTKYQKGSPSIIFRQMIAPALMMQCEEKKRVTTIALDDEENFEKLLKYKGKLSYRGNLSIVLVDVNWRQVVREEFLSLYADDMEEEKISLMKM